MKILMLNPNGVNKKEVPADKVELHKNNGWTEANPEPVKEVVDFQKSQEEIKQVIEEKTQEQPKEETPSVDATKKQPVRKRKPAAKRRTTKKK